MEKENKKTVEETAHNEQPSSKAKKLKWLWITLSLLIVVAIGAWIVYNGIQKGSVDSVFSMSVLLVGIFIIIALGYLLGSISIKGVSLGDTGVFLVAILFGFVCSISGLENVPVLGKFYMESTSQMTTFYKTVVSNIGLVMFVASVGLNAGPKFFRDLKKNFKTYILMGVAIILAGTAVAVTFALLTDYGPEFWSGVLSGALTSTPGYSAAKDAAALKGTSAELITLGHAIAYPFGVVGVVLFVQLIPKFLKADMNYERSMLKVNFEEKGKKAVEGLFCADELGLTPFAIAVVGGLILGAIKIPLPGGAVFSLGTTGGVLIMCLIAGHLGRLGKLSLQVPAKTTKVLKELGLILFLIGAGVEGGVGLTSAIKGDPTILLWGLLGGVVMTIVPMMVGFALGKKLLKLPLLNALGSITGGMTSTPALGTLINTAETEDVAGAYASTYPIALVLIVLACNLMIGLIG